MFGWRNRAKSLRLLCDSTKNFPSLFLITFPGRWQQLSVSGLAFSRMVACYQWVSIQQDGSLLLVGQPSAGWQLAISGLAFSRRVAAILQWITIQQEGSSYPSVGQHSAGGQQLSFSGLAFSRRGAAILQWVSIQQEGSCYPSVGQHSAGGQQLSVGQNSAGWQLAISGLVHPIVFS